MISRIFNQKLKRFSVVCLLIGVLVIIILAKHALETGQWYKAGFYALAYALGSLIILSISLIRNLPADPDQKTSEKKIQDLKNELSQARKSESLGILAGSVAHDLNNILSGMATYPEVLMMDKNLDPKMRQGLDIIRDSGQKASAVVRDLLTISRGSGAVKEALNINQVMDRYLRAHDFEKIKNRHAQVAVNVHREPELLNINASYIHMENIIMNLLLNAFEEVSEKNDAIVTIETANTYAHSGLAGFEDMPEGEYVRLSVADNGSGIREENMARIFEPFYTKKKMGKSGTGLGLTVVWNAVKDHDGFIKLSSGETGTRFDLFFPATRDEIEKEQEKSTIDEIMGSGEVILVVDDLEIQKKIALGILEKLGYRAFAVSDGNAAVDFVKKHSTDLIILDMVMPESLSGLETFQAVRKIKPDQKAIIASGADASGEVDAALELGAGCFIKKPYTVLDMGIAVKEELEK